jgi:hypothetical protein
MKTKNLLFGILYLLIFLQFEIIYSQNYRNPKAYIEDFEKNEAFVKESLIEYSSSIIYGYKNTRTQSTLERIYFKLEAINSNLIKNDIGYLGDTSLKDAFLKMNSCTITLLKNKSLRLNDYDYLKTLDFPEILNYFTTRKQDIIDYYALIVDYTNCKRIFCKKNNVITDRYFNKKNLFEYDAHQSLIFFKLSVLDAKLSDLLLTTDYNNTSKCVFYLNQICYETQEETEKYKKVHIDHSLNNVNIEYIDFLLQQNQILIPMYKDYMQISTELNNAKEDKNILVEDFNEKVKSFNFLKNTFFDNLYNIQIKKKDIVDKWYNQKWLFLKNNL